MFVIPMAGLSSRFFKAGYTQPKYMLKARDETLFAHAVNSFADYFEQDRFLFVVRSDYDTPAFVAAEAERLGITDFELVVLDRETAGQAETVALALNGYSGEPLYIFNIDTFRPGYRKPSFCDLADGYLETFIGSGKNWSNIEPQQPGSDRVIRTAEKQEISEYCCTGLYHWGSADLYRRYYDQYARLDKSQLDAGEQYVAPMYNLAIRDGCDIRFSVIEREEVIFCGTPDEYTAYLGEQ
ncbi:glycosyltransferase family 2 protein [Motiliproteus sediminis]|uniref:glycosyltransferase family 2 protein n=1 Tax=Motiliproteus sediminis TaxID=1468178 RepID=UPI001FE79959|nr:glycosyltransferase family 2 protein [Motiliproteus sediminis]